MYGGYEGARIDEDKHRQPVPVAAQVQNAPACIACGEATAGKSAMRLRPTSPFVVSSGMSARFSAFGSAQHQSPSADGHGAGQAENYLLA